jgi:DNA end-binding protein Ku
VPERGGDTGLRPFWSGTIAFGLVSLPVGLYVANRGKRVSLRLIDEEGTPLSRRYLCPVEEKLLSDDEIVRGFEIAREEFVVVSDEELEALAPEKSQEIDLRWFVALDQIDPVFFERAYFLAPGKGASKAYRLLARAMEDAGRAGIASFVMRGKEYLVAIIAEKGILRAETLRFADELRSPEDVGLPAIEEADAANIQIFEREIDALSEEDLDRKQLSDRQADRLLELVERKLATGSDVVAAPEELEPEEGDEVVDLMRILKESLEEVTPAGRRPRQGAAEGRRAERGGSHAERAARAGQGRGGSAGRGGRRKPAAGAEAESVAGDLGERSKAELYEQAKELDISGRSGMTKEQLIDAIRGPR